MEIELIVGFISIIIAIIVSTASLAHWLGKKFTEIDYRFKSLENAFKQFNELLLTFLHQRNVLGEAEILSLKAVLRALIPSAKSKYYTKEVYERLVKLLDKDVKEYTMEDVEAFNEIADLIEREGIERNDKRLIEYAHKLRLFALVVKVAIVYPKLVKLTESSKFVKELVNWSRTV
jgi:Flp pilus assembly pilin Flp